jgi:DegV family protein with EDD domain
LVRKYKVGIVVDSAACIPSDMAANHGIHVVPHVLIIEGRTYRDGVDMEPGRFYEILQRNQNVPSTSAPKPNDFLEAFKAASHDADSVLCLTLSETFSSTYNSARVAREMAMASMPETRVRVVDTRAAAGAEGLIALEAARQARSGADMDVTAAQVDILVQRVNLIAMLDTLYYLGRGGRVPKVAAWAGSILGMKPIAEMRLGDARLLEKPRTRTKAIERLFVLFEERIRKQPLHVNVMHTDALVDASSFKDQIAKRFKCDELYISEFTPVMGAHLGPGLLGVAFY